MSDDRLREAERAFHETGGLAEEARLLLERVRAGVLASERLELAAELRQEAAVLALGGPSGPRSHSLPEALEDLERFGTEVVVRAALVVARHRLPPGTPIPADVECLAALRSWLEAPLPRPTAALEPFVARAVHADVRLALFAALGSVRHATAILGASAPSRLPWPVLVAAVRAELAWWALAPHEPRSRRAPDAGTLLDLRVGCKGSRETFRLLLETDRISLGGREADDIHFPLAPRAHCEIARSEGGFELRDGEGAFVNANVDAECRLATGDVLSLADAWAEVRILAAPFDDDVERARHEAVRLLERYARDRRRIEVAAAAGHIPAILAASMGRLRLEPRFDVVSWALTLGDLPPVAAAAAVLGLGRAVEPIWSRAFPEEARLARALDAVSAWLEAPKEATRSAVLTMSREWTGAVVGIVHAATELPDAERRAASAAALVVTQCLAAVAAGGRALALAAGSACEAGLPPERVRALIEEKLLRWALGA